MDSESKKEKETLLMSTVSRHQWRMAIPITLAILTLILSLVFTLASRGYSHAAAATQPVTQISLDPFHNPGSLHETEVEPDTFAFGNTVVSAFQQGRIMIRVARELA
jgi:hypothetical protein